MVHPAFNTKGGTQWQNTDKKQAAAKDGENREEDVGTPTEAQANQLDPVLVRAEAEVKEQTDRRA